MLSMWITTVKCLGSHVFNTKNVNFKLNDTILVAVQNIRNLVWYILVHIISWYVKPAYSVEVSHAALLEGLGDGLRGDHGGHRMAVTHRLADRHNVGNHTWNQPELEMCPCDMGAPTTLSWTQIWPLTLSVTLNEGASN